MMHSLRSRLIVGMVLGMTLLLLAACGTLYAVQRRQLYRAFDDALLASANALVLLIHHGSPDFWFDVDELATLPADRIRQGTVFQFWSDYPIRLSTGPAGPGRGDFEDGPPLPPPDGLGPPGFFGDRDGPPGLRRGPGREPPGFRRGRGSDQSDSGVLVIRSPLLAGADLPRISAQPGQPRFENLVLPSGAHGRAVALELNWEVMERRSRQSSTARITAVVAASTTEIETQLRFLATLLALTALGTMAVAGGVVWLVVSRGLKPLAVVARNIAAMDESGLKQRIADYGVPREIQPVVNQLNGLLGRLGEAFERERALTADVAHELRSPVAEIRTIAEITLSQQREPGEYRQAIAETLDTIKTLQELIERLLMLARLEAGTTQPELELVPLQPLLAHHGDQIRKRIAARGVSFEIAGPPETTILADPKLLGVVLSNVLFNAAAYVPDGGRITAEIQPAAANCRLNVANSDCALDRADVAKVFDRFWRADPSRSKTGVNCGLGLTLVRRAMEAMGGTAQASLSDDRRFVLTLEFQLPPPLADADTWEDQAAPEAPPMA